MKNLCFEDLSNLLEPVDLSDTDLRHANLTKSNLYGGSIRRSDLRGAILRDTDMKHANLSGSVCSDTDFRTALLYNADLSGSDFSGSNLRGVNLQYTDCRDTLFAHADLSGADLRYTDLTRVVLRKAILCGADLRGAKLNGADFTDQQGAKTMEYINLTPHKICLYKGDEIVMEIPPSGTVCRMVASVLPMRGGSLDVPVEYHQPMSHRTLEGLPPPQDGCVYLVSVLCLEAAARVGRGDVLAPNTDDGAVRDANGRIMGTRSLIAAVERPSVVVLTGSSTFSDTWQDLDLPGQPGSRLLYSMQNYMEASVPAARKHQTLVPAVLFLHKCGCFTPTCSAYPFTSPSTRSTSLNS